MLLQTGGDGARFRPRLIEGVELDEPPEPQRLVLDGQQRLTSLYGALFCQHLVATRDEKQNYWNSIINKTPLTSHTNRILSGDAPSVYLKRIVQRGTVSKKRLEEIQPTLSNLNRFIRMISMHFLHFCLIAPASYWMRLQKRWASRFLGVIRKK